MEFDELFVPPDVADDYAAGMLTRLFGGIIQRLHAAGDDAAAANNWLESIFTVFNSFCLLMMLGVLSYTIYTMVFDTAADGKTFGQAADTKYTILRTLAGVIGFVPVAGGFSLGQVAFLWIVLQGSALTDVTWRRIADNMLAGTPLVSGTLERIPPDAAALVGGFGGAFDTLVTGHLCGMNANLIEAMVSGDGDIQPAEITTQGGTGPIQEVVAGPALEVTSSAWQAFNGRQVVQMAHLTRFEEADGGAAFSGRDNYCGAVALNDSYGAEEDGDGNLEVHLLASRAQQQFSHLAENVMPGFSGRAHDVAQMILSGERDAEALLAPSRAAVYEAVTAYLAGPATSSTINSVIVTDAHEALSAMVTTEGWMMAPIWQRGVAGAVTAIEAPGTTLRMDLVRESRVTDFLSGEGYRVGRFGGDAQIRDLLRKANADQDTWDEVAGYVRSLPPPDAASPSYVSLNDEADTGWTQKSINFVAGKVFEVFSPVASNTEDGNFGYIDPMLQVQKQGAILSSAGTALMGLGVGGDVLAGNVIASATGLGEAASNVTGAMTSIGTTLLVFGIIMSIVLPLVPAIYFYTAVMSWLLQTLEAMFAIPLAILQLFTPSRDATLIGNFSRVLLAVFSVFIRPFFMVVGLILAMMVIAVSLSYLHAIFGRLMFFDAASGMDSGGDGGVFNIIGFAQVIDGVTGIIAMVAFLGVYVLCAFLTVLYGSQIVSEFGEYALNQIGVASSRFTQPSNIADRTVLAGGVSYAGSRNIGGFVGQARTAALKGATRKSISPSDMRSLPRK